MREGSGIALATALRWTTVCCAVVVAFVLLCFGARGARAATAASIDFAGQAYDVLPPGEDGGFPPDANSTSQIALYDGLTPLGGRVTSSDLGIYFKSEHFGVQGPVVRAEDTGHPGLTIVRDSFDVPHVYGRTRDDVMFGSGWVAAEDRGLLMEEARGPARVAALDVPGLDAFKLLTSLRVFIPSAQTEAFIHAQVRVLTGLGAKGRRVLRDFEDWVDGINAYYQRNVAPSSRPAPWTIDDAIAVFSFIGSIFGHGGGDEVVNSDLLASLQAHLGRARGQAVFRDLREVNDPEAPVSIPGYFPYEQVPTGPTPGSLVIDPGSIINDASYPGLAAADRPKEASNALLVGASRSATGHPLAVMGPQVGYYYPQLLMEADLHGGGIDARGAVAPVDPYVLVGRGKDFAWSFTSAYNDNVDQFLERLCNRDGSRPTRASTSYFYRGRCRAMTRFTAGVLKGTGGQPDRTIAYWQTVHGPVSGTVTVHGRPYAIATLRSTRGREPASALALADLNDNSVHSPQTFFDAANEMETTFNLFYIDAKNIAMFSTGRLPIRAPGVDPSLPTLGTGQYDWRGFLAMNQHPHAINPRSGLILNWNNKDARGWGADDTHWSRGSVQRVQLFVGFKRRGNTLADVVSVMNRAATQDVRAVLVWPIVAKVLAGGRAPSRLAQQAVNLVSTWARRGASRLDTTGDGKITDPGAAVLDATWKGIADAVLRPVLGPVLPKFAAVVPEDDPPNPTEGSYFSGGVWYQYVSKDLRTELGEKVAGRFTQRYCGNGNLNRCRASLWAAIQSGVNKLAASQGMNPAAWRSSATAERLIFIPGLIPNTMRWTNRSAFQQAITFTGHR
jgi:acyl-homoserine lactone acylase PvdQ